VLQKLGAIKKLLIVSTVFFGILGSADEGIRCLYVDTQGVLQLKQSAQFGIMKKAQRKMNILGLTTDTLVNVLEWEIDFKPSFLDSNIESLKSKFVSSYSNILSADDGVQISGSSELGLDPGSQIKVKKAQALEHIDSINSENKEFDFELTQEQSDKILQKYASKQIDFINSESLLSLYEKQEMLFEALAEFIPHYMFKLSDEQMDYLQGKLPESKTESKEELALRIEKSIKDLEEKTYSDAEIALFNLSTEIEEHLGQANSIFYMSEIPEVQKNERLAYDSDRLYVCETPKVLDLPKAKADGPTDSQEGSKDLRPKKKAKPNGLNV